MPVPAGLGVITLDTDLRIRSWNDWLVASTGIPHADAVGRPITEFLSPTRLPVLRDELADVLHTGITRMLAPALHQFLIRCPPPEPNPFFDEMQQRVMIAPLRDEAAVVGIIVTIEDVTMRMVTERERSVVPADHTRDLVGQSGAEDWRVRAEAVRSLRRGATESQVAQLLEALERDHNNFSVLSGALQVLVAGDGIGSITAPLVALLGDSSPNLRMHAALALGAVGGRDAVPALLRALHDADSNVRFHAIEALGRLAAPEAVDGLREAAASGDFFIAFPAIDALARIDDPAVVPALTQLLGDDELRPAIVEALAALCDEDCVGLLTSLLNDGRADASLVATALSRIAHRYETTCGGDGVIVDAFRAAITPAGLERLVAAMRSRTEPSLPVIAVLGWAGVPTIGALVSVLGQGPFQEAVTQAIAGMGASAVPELLSQLRHGPRDAKIASASLLGTIGEPTSAPALVEALASHDAELVSAAARALAALGEGVSLESLLPLFAHSEATVRHAAMAAVNALGSAAAGRRLSPLLRDPDAHVRECAIRTAGYFALEDCAEGIRQAVDDENEDVRRAALEQLPLIEHEQSLELLLRAVVRETPRNRAAAAHALRLVDGAAATSALLEALGDSDPWVRYFAVGSLAQRGTTAAVNVLEAMALVDAAPHVRIAALSALGVLGAEALVRVVPVATADADEDVAAAAIRALSPDAGGEAEPLLSRALLSDREAVQTAAAAALGGFPTVAAVEALAWAARLEQPPSLAPTAFESLRRMADTADGAALAVPALLDLTIEPGSRERIAQVLSELSPASAVPLLAEHLASPRTEVRVVAVDALARMCRPEATALVATALTDPEVAVRAAAVTAVGRLGSSSVAQTMVSLSHSDPDAGVRRRAKAVCRRYGWTPVPADPGTR